MVEWHHQLYGHEFEQALVVGDIDREAWCAAVHGLAKIQTRLRPVCFFAFLFHGDLLDLCLLYSVTNLHP